jgi:hypothetical protein
MQVNSDLARETDLSEGYVSKLLAWGWAEDEIREKAERAGFQRELRAWRMAARERYEKRHR